MRGTLRMAAAGAALVLAVGAGVAQDNPRPGGRPGGFGGAPDGFGGAPGGGAGGNPATLLQSAAVREEVKVTEEQTAKLKEWAEENRGKMREKMQEAMKDAPRDQMREKLAALMAEMNKETYAALGDVLKPEQVKRIKQISMQAQGIAAFRSAEVQEALKLTADQKSKVQSIVEDADKDRRDLMRGAGLGQGQRPDREKMEGIMKKINALNQEAFAEAEKSLTSEQKDAWKELTGEAFDLTKIQPGPGPGPGQGGRPGGRQRGNNAPKAE